MMVMPEKGLAAERQEDQEEKAGIKDTGAYFKQMRARLVIWLIALSILPHALFTLYFHIQFTTSLKKADKLNLAALSESQGNTIDLFMQERVVNLFNLFHSREFNTAILTGKMSVPLQSLRRVSDAFVDVGFINPKGIQIGYAGPFPYLQGKNYSNQAWFRTFMRQDRNYFISDIYLGFRNKPHFTIATKQLIDGQWQVLRATLDPDKLYMLLRTLSHGQGIESALINATGLYQIVDPDRGGLLGKSPYIPPRENKAGVQEMPIEGDSTLIAYTWLKEADWALLVSQPFSVAHEQMYQVRKIMITSLIIFLIVTGLFIIFFTKRFVERFRWTAERSQTLQSQLFHASKLASIGELSTGVAHEINNPLAIITATSGVVRDMLDPKFAMDGSSENVLKEIDIIESAAFRAGKITRQLLDFGHDYESHLSMTDVNAILDEVISGVKAREFEVANIEIIRGYDPSLPQTLLDPDQIRQVFLNIINNAGDAITDSGRIMVSTAMQADQIIVTIRDTGMGMPPGEVRKIFDPFFTTKEVGKGTGLGLSVSLSIVESMGGTISVQSLKGEGSSFTITLPVQGDEDKLSPKETTKGVERK